MAVMAVCVYNMFLGIEDCYRFVIELFTSER
jgi:hypothetical protein